MFFVLRTCGLDGIGLCTGRVGNGEEKEGGEEWNDRGAMEEELLDDRRMGRELGYENWMELGGVAERGQVVTFSTREK